MNVPPLSTFEEFEAETEAMLKRPTDNREARKPKFKLEPFAGIEHSATEEWLIKGLIPRNGVGLHFGSSQAFKTFVGLDIGLHVAMGRDWAGRRVTQASVVYIAAEAAAGVRKRITGWKRSNRDAPSGLPFHLIAGAPNLGVGADDLQTLIACIEAANVRPGLIKLDTVSKMYGGGDENGAGMLQLLANMESLSAYFGAFVMGVHHVGLNDERRERGHSSAQGATDVRILSQRAPGAMSTTLTIEKMKDEESGGAIRVDLARVVIGHDEDGDEISTLVVTEASSGAPAAAAPPPARAIPKQQRLLMDVLTAAISEAGQVYAPFGRDGATVQAVDAEIVRRRYYARVAEKPREGDDAKKLADRQRQAFNTAVKSNIDAQRICADDKSGVRLLWLP
ncbi:MAG: AAA family ATPase [Rhodoblastus sp.]|nr:AAA family ATPase [Rhodoblastus sp.]MCC2113678.1 AAA family ATPase [Hyphomicrobiales bacterium]